jgi:carboxylesterase type B
MCYRSSCHSRASKANCASYSLGSTDDLPDGGGSPQSEDCLFLDLQVPAKAFRNPSLKLPVVVFIYGGAYVRGDKDQAEPIFPLYDGTGLISQSDNNIIFISFNYRVGALGFLAGSSMEKDGIPNAGLWDQRAVFEWVQNHISQVGGDPNQVTAMGESAGASSILFHLVAEGGTLDPMFQKAILLSPAYQPMWDRAGTIEIVFQSFATLAGCEGTGLDCLRDADTAALAKANKALMKQQMPGTFAVGPTPDGSFIRQLPTAEMSLRNIWPIESLILSHCGKEARLFVNGDIDSNGDFNQFLSAILPNSTLSNGITERVLEQYPPPSRYFSSKGPSYKSQADRLELLIRDSCMTCNVRYLAEALGPSKVWVMQYDVFPGWHATDLIPLFWNAEQYDLSGFVDYFGSLLSSVSGLLIGGLSRAYRSYFISYVRYGDPNKDRISRWGNSGWPGTKEWRRPQLETKKGRAGRVLDVEYGIFDFFGEIEDAQMPKDKCDFWKQFAMAGTVAGGYVPEGEVLDQDWVDDGGASDNYGGGNTLYGL